MASEELKYLLGLLILLNSVDGVITYFLVELDVGREGNPFLLRIVHQPAFMLIKVVGVILCSLILWDISRRHPKLAIVATSCFIASYAVIVFWNSRLFLGSIP